MRNKHRFILLIISIVFIGLFMSTNLHAGWTTDANMPTARDSLTSSVVASKIYVIGGENSNGNLNTVEEYDSNTDTWTTKANMPTERYGLTSSAVNDKIYVIGGRNSNGFLNTVEEYNPSTNTWTTKTSTPTARKNLTSSVVNGKIYAIGGNNGSSLDTVEEYNPTTNTWTTKAPMPTVRQGLTSSVVNGKIYAIGGNNGSSLDTVEEYNPTTNTWTTKANMPTARHYLTSSVVNDKIYVIGGNNSNYDYLNTVEEYNPATNTWTTDANIPTARGYLTSSVVDNTIYTIGGYNGSHLNTVESLGFSTVTPSVITNTYYNDFNLTLTTNQANSTGIYYTTDGTDPDNTSTLYSNNIPITQTTEIKAISYDGTSYSGIMDETYTMQATDPIINFDTNTYYNDFNVTIDSNGTNNSSIYIHLMEQTQQLIVVYIQSQ